jgi:hypothetical protein
VYPVPPHCAHCAAVQPDAGADDVVVLEVALTVDVLSVVMLLLVTLTLEVELIFAVVVDDDDDGLTEDELVPVPLSVPWA